MGYRRPLIERHVSLGTQVWIASDVFGAEKCARNRWRCEIDPAHDQWRKCVRGEWDIFLDVDCAFHEDRNALATLAVALEEDDGRFGAICLNRKWQLAAFLEKDANSAPSEGQKLDRFHSNKDDLILQKNR